MGPPSHHRHPAGQLAQTPEEFQLKYFVSAGKVEVVSTNQEALGFIWTRWRVDVMGGGVGRGVNVTCTHREGGGSAGPPGCWLFCGVRGRLVRTSMAARVSKWDTWKSGIN